MSTDSVELERAISSAIFDPGAEVGMKHDRTLTQWQTDAVMNVLQRLQAAASVPPDSGVADEWRDLALQFDGHRIEALSMLRYAVRHIKEYATVRDILREPL